MFIRNNLWPEITNMECEHDQVWFGIASVPQTNFGFVYIPPRDSPYFTLKSFATIQEHSVNGCETVLIGDLNCRLGTLETFVNRDQCINYTDNPDRTLNLNGKDITSICKTNNLLPVNHLMTESTQCDGGLTYRKKDRWISQVDWAFCSRATTNRIGTFTLLQDIHMPTDHAALILKVEVTRNTAKNIFASSKELGINVCEKPSSKSTKHPITTNQISNEVFVNNLPSIDNMWNMIDTDQLDIVCDCLSDTIYESAKKSKTRSSAVPQDTNETQSASDRWRKLLSMRDDKQVWAAINWNGSCGPIEAKSPRSEKPSDREFCDYFESLLNEPNGSDFINYTPEGRFWTTQSPQRRWTEVCENSMRIKPPE